MSLVFIKPGLNYKLKEYKYGKFHDPYFYWLANIGRPYKFSQTYALLNPGSLQLTYPVRIVKIDLVPVLQAERRAGSELELRGEESKRFAN